MMKKLVAIGAFLGTALALQGKKGTAPPTSLTARVLEPSQKSHGDPLRPRMLAARGCSGSSAIVGFTRELLQLHGIPVPWGKLPGRDEHGRPVKPKDGYPAELLNPNVNFFYDEAGGDIGHALEMAYDDLSSQNMSLLFKGMLQYVQGTNQGQDAWNSVRPVFKRLKPLAVLIPRRNVLDQIVCQIRDCFDEDAGFPVDNATGQESHLCFARRDAQRKQTLAGVHSVSNAVDGYMANVRVGALEKHMLKESQVVDRVRLNLEEIGISAPTVFSEDLLDFQTQVDAGLRRGLVAWTKLLRGLGVEPDEEVIKAFLWRNRNTYHMPPPHREVIYNFDEVAKKLHGSPYENFIRA